MNFNEISLNLFNESNSYFNLLVFESTNNNIYDSIKMKNIVGTVKDINYNVVTVESIELINSNYYYKINYRNKIKGYFKSESSIILLPKSKQQVKLTPELNFNNELNRFIDLDNSLFQEINKKIAYSSSLVIFKNVLYEMVLYKNEIVGFFQSNQLEHLVRNPQLFKIISETTIYKDSSLEKKITSTEGLATEFKSDFLIPTRNILRFRYDNLIAWVSISSTNLEEVSESYKPITVSDALLKSIMYQYEEKLDKSHQYHLRILNKELRKVKGD